MIHPATKLRRLDTQNKAKIQAKKDFNWHCIITAWGLEDRPNSTAYDLDPAHLFASGDFPELKSVVENIFPMIRKRHSWRGGFPEGDIGCLDLIDGKSLSSNRGVTDRIRWLVDNTHEKMWDKVRERLILLIIEGAKISRGVLSRREEALAIINSRGV